MVEVNIMRGRFDLDGASDDSLFASKLLHARRPKRNLYPPSPIPVRGITAYARRRRRRFLFPRRIMGELWMPRVAAVLTWAAVAALWTSALIAAAIWGRGSLDQIVALTWTQQAYVAAPATAASRGSAKAAVFDLREFGGVGDGVAVETEAFERAVSALAKSGGGRLHVPNGTWLTGPFNLTSHMTLFLDAGAVILGIEDESYWPLLPPLPSYGCGRETRGDKGPRYGSLIHGQNLKDVVITGNNGTINGQGKEWWRKYRQRLLNHTRGPLVQLMWSRDIIIANITLRDSPFWTFHPYDCKNITVTNVTILAPVLGAPNTDGIDPDSCEDMVIENSYICVGDDAVAIKSGWDQYGMAYGRPSKNILLRNLILRSVVSAGVSIGSEMSGGVSNVTMENIHFWETKRAVRIKTAAGRGGYVHNVSCRNLTFDNVRVGIVVKTDYNEHPDEDFDPKAFPSIENISFTGVHGQNVRVPVRIHGSDEIPVRGVSFRDLSVGITYKKRHIFQCSYVEGRAIGVIFPAPCDNLDLYDEQGRLVKPAISYNISDIDYSL